MLKSDHCRRVTFRMTLSGNIFLRGGGSAGEPGGNEAGEQQTDRQYRRRRQRDGGHHRGCRQGLHRRDTDRYQGTHQHVGQFINVRADPRHQLTAGQADSGRRRSVRQPVIDLRPRRAGRA